MSNRVSIAFIIAVFAVILCAVFMRGCEKYVLAKQPQEILNMEQIQELRTEHGHVYCEDKTDDYSRLLPRDRCQQATNPIVLPSNQQ